MHFTDHSQHSQMVMALTLRCPLKLEASLCQRQGWHTLCEDLPNATAQESDGVRQASPGPEWAGLGPRALLLTDPLLPPQWYVLEKVDLHPQLCFKVQTWARGGG